MANNLSGIRDYVPVTRAEIRAIVKDELHKAFLSEVVIAVTQPQFDAIYSHIEAVEESVTVLGTMIGEKVSEVTDLLDQIDARTTELGSEVSAIVSELQGRPDVPADLVTRLQNVSDNLNGIAADPNNPVPPPA